MGPGTALANKYFELEQKIAQARLQDYTIVRTSDGKICPYEAQRQEVIDKYFNGCYGQQSKIELLNVFEKINEYIKASLGL